jgi:hypothetical protein
MKIFPFVMPYTLNAPWHFSPILVLFLKYLRSSRTLALIIYGWDRYVVRLSSDPSILISLQIS